MSGIVYKITCKTTQKSYIGSTETSLNCRWLYHMVMSKDENFQSIFYQAIRKYGLEDFTKEIIIKGIPSNVLAEEETRAIAKYGTLKPNGYNSMAKASRPNREKIRANWDELKLERFEELDIIKIEVHEVLGILPKVRLFVYIEGEEKPRYVAFEYRPSDEDCVDGRVLLCEERGQALERAFEFATSVTSINRILISPPKVCKVMKDLTKLPGERQSEEPVDKAFLYLGQDTGEVRIGVYFQTDTKWLFDSKINYDNNMEKRFFYLHSRSYDDAFKEALAYACKHTDNVFNMIQKHADYTKENLEPHPTSNLDKDAEAFREKYDYLETEGITGAVIKVDTHQGVLVFIQTTKRKVARSRDPSKQMPRKRFVVSEENDLLEAMRKARTFAHCFTDTIDGKDVTKKTSIPIKRSAPRTETVVKSKKLKPNVVEFEDFC